MANAAEYNLKVYQNITTNGNDKTFVLSHNFIIVSW